MGNCIIPSVSANEYALYATEQVKEAVTPRPTPTGVYHGGELPNKPKNKGSARMGLPEKMSPETVSTVKEVAAIVWPPGEQALDNTYAFYKNMLWGGTTPSWDSKVTGEYAQFPGLNLWSVFSRTNQLNGMQPAAQAANLTAFFHNIDDLSPLLIPGGAVEMIAHKHCALNIYPEYYPTVAGNKMNTMKQHYPKEMTPPVEAAWGEAMGFFAKVLIDHEERLYTEAEERSGGWRGLKVFTVAAIEDVATNIKAFTFVDMDLGEFGGYEFTPGQYLTIKCDVDNDGLTCPRHYTITSAPGDKFLQITVKKLSLGKVSSYLHEKVKVGDTVQLSPPFGLYSPPPNSKSAVLISAGVGATPMVNFMRHYEKHGSVALIAHVDVNAAAYPFRAFFEKSGKLMTHYTNCTGKPVPGSPGDINLGDFASKIMDKVGIAHDFFVCGPPEFSRQVKVALCARGARCHCENFGPQLSTNCPYVTDKCPFRR